MRKIFLPPSLYLGIENIDNEKKGKLFELIYRYNLGLDYEIPDDVKDIFGFFKPFFDGDIKNYNEKIVKRNQENGKLGGRPVKDYDNSQKPTGLKKPKQPIDNDTYISISNKDIFNKDILYKDIPIKDNNILFEKFWNMYDKKIAKSECEKKRSKLKQLEKEQILEMLPNFLVNIKDKQFQPHPKTFLNQRRREDEYKHGPDYETPKDFHEAMMANNQPLIKERFKVKYGDDWKTPYSQAKERRRKSPFYLTF